MTLRNTACGWWRTGLALLVWSSVAGAGVAQAQGQRPARPAQPPAGLSRGQPGQDSTRELSKDKVKYEWQAPDSAMRALLDKEGYSKVQYQGDTVKFNAGTRLLTLKGKPSAVQRDETMLIGDSIQYNDSTKRVVATGDTVLLRDPQAQETDDFIANGMIEYDLETRQGTTGAFSTSVVSGQRLFLTAKRSTILSDTLVSGRHVVFAKNGSFTYCDHAEPHFHFTTRDMKFVSQNVMVARPGVLYIGEVPVFWIPFFFQDVRSGRRSGMLTPNFGFAELIRNSPNYRRSVQNIGYFFALNDYMNAELSMDWRSGARSSDVDPGFLRSNADMRYRWVDRFITGEFAVSYMALRNGTTNASWTWNHNQDVSKSTKLTARLNWVQNTQIQRNTTVNPMAANATIRSQLNYQTKIGPASINVGGSRVQYPGRPQVDMDFPQLNVTAGTLEAGPVAWTPSLRLAVSGSSRIDQGIQFPFVYNPLPGGGVDSSRFNASRRNMQFAFETPIKLWDFQWQNSFSVTEQFRDYPEQREIVGVRDTSLRSIRVFARTFETNVDWTTSFNLPRFFQGTWNVSPSINVQNVDQGGLFVRTERSGGRWVSQSKRLSYALTASPTLYAMLPGLGPIARLRHSINPSISYSYSPTASVSDEYLAAIGRSRVGYLGALMQNRVSLNLATNLEAKLRAPVDSEPDQGRKIKLLSVNFSPLSWDFARADSTGNGFTERTFAISARTDLLPGLDFRTSYDLFQGDPLSDTATFSPYRTETGITFSMNGKSAVFGFIARLFGRAADLSDSASIRPAQAAAQQNLARQTRQMNAAGGGAMRGMQMSLPESGQGWNLSLQYNAARQRAPRGNGVIIEADPAKLCEAFRAQGIAAYERCFLNAQTSPPTGLGTGQSAIGAPFVRQPPVQGVNANMSFGITRNWSAQWSTQYDVERARFASQQIGLQRQLHDWNAIFTFSQTPSGNFAFNFFIALKAQPDLKFNYDRQTFRSSNF
ncbi:MAG: LPS-assembly protein LptD [Gemmatimonas sp.]|uniref:putative LPS assembly protein LptD n=1 Tax=Gemmatimonas sp. TaxID=1962908 RepID=UPI0025B94808|nr:putative LPS assembly protein LptD [Gemmatimonas sp.]MCA2986868.1 LPS-assembly protein LptD [Gemmatimonas sp.]